MDLHQVVCMCLLGVVTAYRSSSIHFTDPDPVEQILRCPEGNKPCTIIFREYHSNGTMLWEYRTSNICQCGDGISCPREWENDQPRTVTRYLRTLGKVMTLQLKFCNQVQTERVCELNEVALTLKGTSVLPQEVTSVNCRCADNDPLHLQSVWFETPHERHQNFVCNMPHCAIPPNGNAPCLLNYRGSRRRETLLLCKCPGTMQCRLSSQDGVNPEYTLGYCRPEH